MLISRLTSAAAGDSLLEHATYVPGVPRTPSRGQRTGREEKGRKDGGKTEMSTDETFNDKPTENKATCLLVCDWSTPERKTVSVLSLFFSQFFFLLLRFGWEIICRWWACNFFFFFFPFLERISKNLNFLQTAASSPSCLFRMHWQTVGVLCNFPVSLTALFPDLVLSRSLWHEHVVFVPLWCRSLHQITSTLSSAFSTYSSWSHHSCQWSG